NFTIPTPERPSDWGVTVEPGFLELLPNQQGTVQVTMRAPAAAEVGEKATAIVKVRSSVERTRERTLNLEARVSGPDLFVDNVLVNASNPYSGDPLEVTVVLGNSGNKAHDKNTTLRLYFVQNGVETVIGEKVYPALFIPGQRRISETFAWDTRDVEGAGVLLARIDVDDTVKEIDDSASSNERTRPLTLRTFDIKVTPAQGLSARPGERLTYSESPNVFIATYSGNQPSEPVTIRFESEHGWLSSQSELSLALPRGTPIPIIASLDIPALPGAATDALTITIVPSLRPHEVIRASATTTIVDEEKPIIKAIRVTPAQGVLGQPVIIEVDVEDATGAASATAYVTFPTNETSAVTLLKVEPGKFRGERTFTVAGSYRVAAEAIDSATPANKNDTRLALASFTMAPGSAPTIRLADGQPTTIRTGSAIKLDIRDPLGIGKATYSIKGVSYDLRGPNFQIDTSTFQAGTVDLNVTAENIYGVSSSQRFSFVVDNAAPGITRVALEPERPRANEDVTITVQTEAKVENVDVLIKRDGQVVQTLNATKRGVGTFVVTFNPPQGDYRIDVTARDAAGNTRLAESAVVFSAKPGSPFSVPGPAPWLVLVALVGVALLLRQRRR
ncbi:MAG TPA: CARDB domain-containing protein, partial [Candidatus Thermoplasmatota archaeon]|nr:CARDB domain-containing protein [Candidatus Thermoplasmatota archaeon]